MHLLPATPPRYVSSDPAAEINGDSGRAVLASPFVPPEGLYKTTFRRTW